MLYESETDPNFENEFPVFLEIVARVALNQPRIEEFVEAIATLAPKLTATSLFSQIPVDEHEKFARFLARSFWNSIPWPDNRFQPKPLPREGRNDRCRCGSGAKYKNCCSHYEQFPLDFPPDMLLPYILDQMP
ncbi:MAG: SEC-C metal-binding domain-containing protein, partial [Gammaproteobacteria bacterium]|nr:SEC-C metal-binding domain-containing protein [Gammaproteobacteria bacterium]